LQGKQINRTNTAMLHDFICSRIPCIVWRGLLQAHTLKVLTTPTLGFGCYID